MLDELLSQPTVVNYSRKLDAEPLHISYFLHAWQKRKQVTFIDIAIASNLNWTNE